MTRTWDRYLTEQDRAHVALAPARAFEGGARPVLLLVDLYRWAFGDRPQRLLESVKTWPGSCGLAGWQALPSIQALLAEARAAQIPVIHVTGIPDLPDWGTPTRRQPGEMARTSEMDERRRKAYEIIDEVSPLANEVVLHKSSPSAFWGTPLVGHLNYLGADTVVVAGESTSGCVRATVVDGRSNRYRMVVVEECVFDRHEATHAINLFDIDQKYGDVIDLPAAAAYLREHAGWLADGPVLA